MGMYTAFHFASEFKKETPKEVIEIVKYMSEGEGEIPKDLPDAPFFQTSRWYVLFRMDSYYFDAQTHCSFFFDEISKSWILTVTSNLKNYDNEIELFLSWIRPYLNKHEGDFLGYSRYEEFEQPTLLYF